MFHQQARYNHVWRISFAVLLGFVTVISIRADEPSQELIETVLKPGLFKPITEPPCSYCSTQHRKNMVKGDDRVIAWIRGAHNGGAAPLRHFLAGSRIINDTYGLFFYDPDGGYVTVYKKDYGYTFHGWRKGVMLVKDRDGTVWSALSGKAMEGPKQGQRLERVPNVLTNWSHWLMLHPESTAYDLFDGDTYQIHELPSQMSAEAKQTMGQVDSRFDPLQTVVGVEVGEATKAFAIDVDAERTAVNDEVGGQKVNVLWYGPTRSAVVFSGELNGKPVTLYADEISPETAPFKDKETGTRWTLAGRAVDGPLKNQELVWVNSVQCRWYAWAAEYPETEVVK